MRNTINLYCLKYKVTIEELSEKLGITREETIEILKEETIVPSDKLPILCELFHCEPKDLIL